jgi:hypothetical protein
MVSSISFLLHERGFAMRPTAHPESNACATVEPAIRKIALTLIALLVAAGSTFAQAVADPPSPGKNAAHSEGRAVKALRFLAGAGVALTTHEAGHLALDFLFDADPRLKSVDFHGLPFFAITHRGNLSPRREFLISSAGFTVQHLENEWLFARRPNLRRERAPLLKGALAFNIATSAAYAGAAFVRTGPYERDTRGMASASRVDERVIGVMVLAPAVLDAWRYFHPESRWAAWTSRGAKAALLLLVIR